MRPPLSGVDGSDFTRLAAYRQAVELGDAVYAMVREWSSFDRWSIGMQLIRAADSVGANMAEATGRLTSPDKARLLFIARGSVLELEHWVMRARARDLLAEPLDARVNELARTLNGLIRRQRSD